MLRLIRPSVDGKATDPPKRRGGRRSPSLVLTDDEAARVRAALRNLVRAYGTGECLAEVMGIPVCTLRNLSAPKGKRPSVGIVLLAARAAGTTVEQILSGKIAPAGRCPTCGRHQDVGGAR